MVSAPRKVDRHVFCRSEFVTGSKIRKLYPLRLGQSIHLWM